MTMISYYEIGGQIVEAAADYEYKSGSMTAKERRQRKADVKTGKAIVKDVDVIVKVRPADISHVKWQDLGAMAGFGAGVIYGVATLPVTAVDGPFPFMDLAWAASTAKFTRSSVRTGKRIGQFLDEKEFLYE